MISESLHNKFIGERCFILGSGPSINKQDLSLIKNEYTFCTNWFINHKDFEKLNVDFYCAYDANFTYPEINKDWLSRLENFSNMGIFFPELWAGKFSLDNANYVQYDNSIKVYKDNVFNFDLAKPLYDGASVVVNMCIPIAMYMGFNKIILLGCDTNYYSKSHNNPYFYNSNEHKTFFDDSADRNNDWILKVIQSYEIVLKNALKNNTQILNATPGGNLEVFERVKYTEVCDE